MQKKKTKKLIKLSGIFICLMSVVVLSVNMVNMQRYLFAQSQHHGETRLQNISTDMQHTLEKSKITLLRFAADVEVYLATGANEATLRTYLKSQSGVFRDQSGDTLTNAFICTSEMMLVSDSSLPEDYVITERGWYKNIIKSGIENIYITAPYHDKFTDSMCFAATMMLSDGKTIVGLDFNLSHIRWLVEQMNRDVSGETIIISRDGLVVGYTDSEYAGKELEEVLPEYVDIYNRLINQENDSMITEAYIGGKKSTAFCNRSGEWLFVYTVDNDELYSDAYRIIRLNFVPRIAMFLTFLAYFIYTMKRLSSNKEIYSDEPAEDISIKEINASVKGMSGVTKKARNGIMTIMILTCAVAVVFTGTVLVRWGNDRMEREVDSYSYQLERWMNTQIQTLNMFVDTIAANPAVIEDYDYAVEYLDNIVSRHHEISAAYIARPGNEHEMTMNNGWIPNADYKVAERQWYIDTENSENKMSVSSPYIDARTGLYCVTFSKVVYDAETSEQIGIFALDFYIENLTGIMEASYSDSGYAFLVGNGNIIVNHPNEEYQISSDKAMNILGTEYENIIKDDSKVHFVRDYDGTPKVCISRTEPITGFSVIAVKNVMSVYGVVIVSGGIFIVLLGICIVLLYKLIVKMMNWQENARKALIEEAERASQADHAKSSFLAQMSHEIRTPINAMLGMNEMIIRESKEDNILNYASNAYNSGNALLSIINDILDISKIEAGRFEIIETEYELYSLVSDCYHMMANRAEKKNLEFKVSCDESLPSRLSGDMFHIRQIAVNLLTNAVKYTDSGVVEMNISGEKNDEEFALKFTVKDTGIGIKEENIGKLFDSFQRFDIQRNQSIEGTGLGLSICKQLTELMGGSISAESVYGEGSTFICILPQKITNSEPIGKIHLERSPEKRISEENETFTAPEARILVVDDVEMNLFVFTSFLKSHNMQIETALSGKKCIELAAKNKYDIIFMDHMMPEMDGIETFDALRREKYIGDDTPVVMLTANAISGEKEKYLSKGFAAYLTKPIQSAKLDSILIEFLPKEKLIFGKNESEKAAENTKSEINSSELFDVNTGVMYNGDNMEIYHTVLKMYVGGGEAKLEHIRSLAENESWKDYITEVHALKSTSLMIGSKQLSEAAKELEFAGKEEKYDIIREKNESVLELYGKVLDIGREFLLSEGVMLETTAEENGESTEISEEKFDEIISALKKACEDFDDDEAVKICDEAAGYSYNGHELKPWFDEVKSAMLEFEYDDALEKTEAAAKKAKS